VVEKAKEAPAKSDTKAQGVSPMSSERPVATRTRSFRESGPEANITIWSAKEKKEAPSLKNPPRNELKCTSGVNER
jgi:hypothetical protein